MASRIRAVLAVVLRGRRERRSVWIPPHLATLKRTTRGTEPFAGDFRETPLPLPQAAVAPPPLLGGAIFVTRSSPSHELHDQLEGKCPE